MNTKKFTSQIIGFILILCLLAGCGKAPASPTTAPTPVSSPVTAKVDFTGHWEGLASSFSLDLVQNGDKMQGGHTVVAQQGAKIDSLENSIGGTIQGNKVIVHFQSSFTTNVGIAEITFIDANTIFWKVTSAPDGENYFPQEATLAKKALPTPAPAQAGTITGHVHLQGPPTPPMAVYAVDRVSGLWATVTTEATDGEAAFSLSVQPGSYQVFAAVVGGTSVGVGYDLDGLMLATVTVAAGQTVSDINVRPPSQSECGSTLGYPASPDGRYAATSGPKPECLTSIAKSSSSQPQTNPGATRIQFQPGATSWQTPGDLAPNASIRFVLSALKGQILTVELTTDQDSGAGPSASVNISGADGQVYTPNLTTKWQGALMTSQDYYIDVHSLSQQNITYSLLVAIPAIGSTPYVPVTLSVCQTLQEMATQSISTTFTLEASVPFTDPITSEKGRSCNLTATGTGNNFSNPGDVMTKLVSGFGGFTENTAYQAGGPTGLATAVTRDMAVVLISVKWEPAPGAQCPSDQPIASCNLTPEQKLYTIKIQAAMK